jgi:hypothetical protein
VCRVGVHFAPEAVDPRFTKVKFVHSNKMGDIVDDLQVFTVGGIVLGYGFTGESPHGGGHHLRVG